MSESFSCFIHYRQIHWVEQSIQNVLDDTDNDALLYVTESDIRDCYEGGQMLVLEAPLGANLTVGKLDSRKKVRLVCVIPQVKGQ